MLRSDVMRSRIYDAWQEAARCDDAQCRLREISLPGKKTDHFSIDLRYDKRFLLCTFTSSTTTVSVKLELDQVMHSLGQLDEHQGGSSTSSESSSPRSARLFTCPESGCNGRFQRKFTLREHMKTHTGEKPFQCEVKSCGRRFSTSGNMSRHRRLHLSKQFQCPEEGCTRAYSKAEKLALHYRTHMGSNAYPCGIPGCSKAFSTSGNLTRHARKHHQRPATTGSQSTGYSHYTSERCTGTPVGQVVDRELINCYDSGGGIHSRPAPAAPGSSHRVSFDGTLEQEVVDLLQCLFGDEPPAMTATSSFEAVAAPPSDLSSKHFELYRF